MKKSILFIVLVTVTMLSNAQSNYQKAMSKGMEMLKSAKTSEEFVEVSNHFERVGSVEKSEWLPNYWSAYAKLFAGMNAKKESLQDEYYDKALEQVDGIINKDADQSELLTLKAYLTLMKISVSPMSRAPEGTPAAIQMLMEAEQINPANPRPFYVHGQNTFYTPKFFGGGEEAAKPLLTKAVDLYAKEGAVDNFMPRWGKSRAEYLLKECK